MKDYRKIKVTKRYVKSRWSEGFVPEVRMVGKYLKQAGFIQGHECSVKIESGKITILAL